MKRNFISEKDLRLFIKKFLKSRLKGLPADFKFEIGVKTLRPPKVFIQIPAHSEGNLIRTHQWDHLVAELEEQGLGVEVFYLDDAVESQFAKGPPGKEGA